MSEFELLLGGIVAYGWVVQIVGLVCFLFYIAYQRAPKLDASVWPQNMLPGVTLIKPCLGAQDNEAVNFDTFFRQEYAGPIQILFSVSSEDDAAIPVIKGFLTKYPNVDAELVISKTRRATLKKFDALYDAQQKAKHEVIIWSDADVVVRPTYVAEMVASLQDRRVGLVTTPQFDAGINNVATGVKGIANNADVATLVMIYNAFKPVKMGAWGHSIGFRKSDFDRFADFAWKTLDRFIVDDQAMPYIFQKMGLPTVYRNIYCPAHWANKTMPQIFQQKRSWVVFQRAGIGNRWLFLSGMFLYPVLFAGIGVVAFGGAGWTYAFLGVWFTRALAAWVGERLYLGTSAMTLKYAWTIPVWDCIQPYFFWIGFKTKRLVRHGKAYRIENRYFLEPEVADPSGSI